jgi:hypothetical protein
LTIEAALVIYGYINYQPNEGRSFKLPTCRKKTRTVPRKRVVKECILLEKNEILGEKLLIDCAFLKYTYEGSMDSFLAFDQPLMVNALCQMGEI